MTGKIFINYRRGDDAGFTQALYQRLEDEFTPAALFMDVEGHIKPGDDFVEVLSTQVAASDVLLVVIGPRWSDLLAARAGAPDDFVAIEIKAALDKAKRVIPVLVGGASMPRADTLPESIRALARRNAVGLRPERFKADCQGLVSALKEQLSAAETERAARSDAERLAAEAERQRREAEEAQRIAAAEERARAQAIAGLSPEEVRKAEELANWDFIKERSQPQALRDHMARFPGGITALFAMTKLEELVWAGLGPAPDVATLQAFVDEFPKGPHAEQGRNRLAEVERQVAEAKEQELLRTRETEAWGTIAAGTDVAAIQEFLKAWPNGQHAAAAKARIAELKQGPSRNRLYKGIAVAGALVGVAGFFAPDRPLPAFTVPEMVTVPAGSFMMGSSYGGSVAEPIHKVTIKSFEAGKYEVTFDEWDICVKDGGCLEKPSSEGWGRGKQPVINVSWDDVTQQYLPWLSKKTGKTYRLLTEAEWEYAARAGTTTYSWVDDIDKGSANCDGCGSQWGKKQTGKVGSFKPNAFGLFDMHGNVWEWVQDCYADSYKNAPTDGAAAESSSCSSRVLRGGSWVAGSSFYSIDRDGNYPTDRGNDIGFRVARTL